MAIRLKANISYQPIVEEVNRKFVPKKETCSARNSEAGPVTVLTKGWMGGACRNTFRAGLGASKRNYMVIRSNARMTPLSENEQLGWVRFGKATASVKTILGDLSQISRVQQMWADAQADSSKEVNGVSAYGYTRNGWIMAVQYAGLKADPTYNEKQFPASFDA